jgi:thiol-disulfide isomerase/thioredoxin
MKTRLVVLSACISSLIAFAGMASAAESADAQWTELETLLKGPKERPKTQDEAKEMLKKYLAELDAKSEAFRKAYPNDPRRWKLTIQEIQSNSMRGMVGVTPLTKEEISKRTDELLAAPDAEKSVKAAASFYRVAGAESDDAEFAKLAAAHMKEYPDFPGNKQIESVIKRKETEANLKSKPLELAFKATDGSDVDIAKLRGKVVLIDFWATWCGPCVAEVPKIVASYEKLHPKGFEIIGLSFDQDKSALDKFTKEKGMTWVQYFDGAGWKNKFGQQFGINSIPRMWLVDKKGMVVDTNGRADLESKVEKLLAE